MRYGCSKCAKLFADPARADIFRTKLFRRFNASAAASSQTRGVVPIATLLLRDRTRVLLNANAVEAAIRRAGFKTRVVADMGALSFQQQAARWVPTEHLASLGVARSFGLG